MDVYKTWARGFLTSFDKYSKWISNIKKISTSVNPH